MTEQESRTYMAELGLSLFNRGLSTGSGGNMSCRLDDGSVLATPTNSSLGRLNPNTLSKVRPDGTQLSGERMSKEVPFHLELYRAREDCGAVVHLHSTYATAISCLDAPDAQDAMRPFTPYFAMRVKCLPVIPYYKPGSPKIGEALRAMAHESNCFLLANHGPVVFGKTLEEAVNTMEELEETARLFFLFKSSGVNVRYLTDEQLAELRGV